MKIFYSSLQLLLISSTIAAIFSEIILEYFDNRPHKKSFYSGVFTSSNGLPLSSKQGEIKLSVHPAYVYGNLPNQKTKEFSTNNYGYRGSRDIDEVMLREEPIVLTGGSSAFSTGVKSDEDSLAMLLEDKLKPNTIINASTIGHHSAQELVRVVLEIIDLNPKLIISFSGFNDFYAITLKSVPAWGRGFGGYAQIEQRLITMSELQNSNYLKRFFSITKNTIFPNISKKINKIFNKKTVNSNLSTSKAAKTFAANMIKIDRIAQTFGAKHLVIMQPDQRIVTIPEEKHSETAIAYQKFCNIASDELSKSGVNFIDLNQSTIKFSKNSFLDEIHLSKDGNNATAEYLAPKIEQLIANTNEKTFYPLTTPEPATP